MSRLITAVRRKATLLDHVKVDQPVCVYCGAAANPHLYPSGQTRHFDHFIPVMLLAKLRYENPSHRLPNWLLPCCPSCNVIAGSGVFPSFADKLEFVTQRSGSSWTLASNPAVEILMVVKTDKFTLEYAREAGLCTLPITSLELSKIGPSSSAAMP